MSHRVRIRNTGHELTVRANESVLDAALRCGILLPYSCRGGTCGTCTGTIVAGEVRYPDGRPAALSATEEAVGQALLCQARPCTDLVIAVREIRSAGDIAPRILPCRVQRNEPLGHDVRRLLLRTPGRERLQFLPGQYIDILLRDGRRRGFSLANPPHDDELLELHVRHAPGGTFTTHVFETLDEGALLRFEGPLGSFHLREESARPLLFMAGGTGFAPIKSMLEHAFHIGVQRPMHLFWGVRARRDLYLEHLPEAWRRRFGNFEHTPVLSDPEPDDDWSGATGLVHEQLLAEHPQLAGHDIYLAGPPGMIEAARRDFAAHGMDPERLFYDAFDYAADHPAGSPDA